jgi:hypothetical protein
MQLVIVFNTPTVSQVSVEPGAGSEETKHLKQGVTPGMKLMVIP